jgi:hypothetical protein
MAIGFDALKTSNLAGPMLAIRQALHSTIWLLSPSIAEPAISDAHERLYAAVAVLAKVNRQCCRVPILRKLRARMQYGPRQTVATLIRTILKVSWSPSKT